MEVLLVCAKNLQMLKAFAFFLLCFSSSLQQKQERSASEHWFLLFIFLLSLVFLLFLLLFFFKYMCYLSAFLVWVGWIHKHIVELKLYIF